MSRDLPPFAALRAFEAAARHDNFKQAAILIDAVQVIVVRVVKPQYATVFTLVCGMVDISQVIKGITGVHIKLDVQHNWLQKMSRGSFVPGI